VPQVEKKVLEMSRKPGISAEDAEVEAPPLEFY